MLEWLFFLKNSVNFWRRKLTLKVQFWHFLMNHTSLQDCSKTISFEYVDSWAKILHLKPHHPKNSTTELTLIRVSPFDFVIYQKFIGGTLIKCLICINIVQSCWNFAQLNKIKNKQAAIIWSLWLKKQRFEATIIFAEGLEDSPFRQFLDNFFTSLDNFGRFQIISNNSWREK